MKYPMRVIALFGSISFAWFPAFSAEVPTTKEVHPGLSIESVSLKAADGVHLNAVVTKPARSQGRLPAILYVQWLSCDSVAIPRVPSSGWEMMLQRLVRDSGALVWRTEKRGVGGSEGDCSKLDYETELADHRAAFATLRQRSDVDQSKIVVFGASMGATMAPLVAGDEGAVAGLVVWGGGTRTWAERTLAFERNRLELGDGAPADRLSEISARYRLINEIIVLGRSPEQVAAADPMLGQAWGRMAGTGPDSMYGRPITFHQQAQRRNWAGAWSRVRVPVLAMVGEHDWFEDAGSTTLIADIVNRASAGTATAVIVPGLDHHFSVFPGRAEAFRDREGKADPQRAMDILLPWLQQLFRRPL